MGVSAPYNRNRKIFLNAKVKTPLASLARVTQLSKPGTI